VSKQHMKLSVGVLVIVASVAYLIVSGATGKTMYFLTVPEVQQKLTTLTGAPLRVAGKVTDDPIEWNVRHLSLAFVMGEGQPASLCGIKALSPICSSQASTSLWKGALGPMGCSLPRC
jgi:cytochrome c-type biogenesis protein CcmE